MDFKKTYLTVIAQHRVQCITPLSFVWHCDGRSYNIDKVLDIKNAPSLKAGGAGVRYTVLVNGKERQLWLENGKDWFVEERVEGLL